MKTIKMYFQHTNKAYLPEIAAYRRYFEKTPQFNVVDSTECPFKEAKDIDVVWRFMGVDTAPHSAFTIHEYGSLSTGFMAPLKDRIKKYINTKPDMRIFLNTFVKEGFGFKDGVQQCIRDMGVDRSFFMTDKSKEYDFVYCGTITKERKVHLLIDKIARDMTGKKLLVIGSVPDDIYAAYKQYKNIVFTGKLDYMDVPRYAKKAMYGINCVPDIFPYYGQTSTKVLEYCALDLKIITFDGEWIRQFEKRHNAAFLRVKEDFSDFTMNKIEGYSYQIPNVSEYQWDNVIQKSGIREMILNDMQVRSA